MSVQSFEETFYPMTETVVNDTSGGRTKTYVQGTAIKIACYADTSFEARIAAANGAKASYVMNFDKSLTLDYDQYVKRASDSAIFRITGKPSDKQTPAVTSLDRRVVTAERTELPV